jgi:chromosome segregation ATPase
MKNDNLREDLFKLSEARNLLELEVNLTAEEKNKLQSELEYLRPEYFRLKETISVNAVKNDSKESLEAELENLRALAVEKLSELQQITANTQKLAESQNEKLEEIAKLEAGIKALEGRICSGKVVLENLESEIVTTNNQLQQLANLKASVLAIEEGAGQA